MGQKNDEVDVLIIGAGASGGAFAWSLAEAGIRTLTLEQGGWPKSEEFTSTHKDWELHLYSDYHLDPNVRRLPEDYPLNNDETQIVPLMFNAVGGSMLHWGAHFPRLHPSDFRVRSLDGVADDWPITYAELEPFHDLNDRMTGVAGVNGNTAYPPKPPRQTPPIPVGKDGMKAIEGFEKLGWHWWPAESAINSAPYDGRPGCNGAGPCVLGCHTGAKSTTDLTYWPKATGKGARLKTGCRVREITVGKDGLADGAIYYDRNGEVREQKARIVVMAANGVGTPRLLLNSQSPQFPDGLANISGLVGQNLMFHPISMVTGVFDEDLESYKGPLAVMVTSYEFYETDLSRGFVRGVQLQVHHAMGPLHTALGGSSGQRVSWGKGHHGAFAERSSHTVNIAILAEDLPETRNRVVLDPELTDSDGIPAPKIIYSTSENTTKMLEFGAARSIEVFEAAGAKKTLVDPLMRTAGWHLLGTARMGDHASNSVVDAHGRSHDVKNMFIIDGSIWVTAGGNNPTSTIQALALYIADYIKTNSRNLLD